MNNYLTAAQLARHLQVTPATIHAWHRRGWIPGLRAGRRPVLFDLNEVLKSLQQRGSSDNYLVNQRKSTTAANTN